ncbi:MAG: hypothetical protein JNM18_15320 [Planctomycetaceae bacterium]|nr:hypothetical protein [Planctomycetaceae bacterium]
MNVQVLDVGQCMPDHAAIRRLIETNFAAEVVQTDQLDDTLAVLRGGKFALVLINRKLDLDYSDGLKILTAIKAEPALRETPVMLITNYAEHQQTAIAAGAVAGFGKAQLGDPATIEKLAAYLPRKG